MTDSVSVEGSRPTERWRGLREAHLPTVIYSVGGAVSLVALVLPVFLSQVSDLKADFRDAASRIPSEQLLASMLESTSLKQRAAFRDEVDRLAEINAEMDKKMALLEQRANLLDERIANIGIDRSADLIRILKEIRLSTAKGHEGGPADLDDLFIEDYALRLVARDTGMRAADARKMVDAAFANPKGPEARRLIRLAEKARVRNAGVVIE